MTVEGFKAKNVELDYEIQELMKRFDFYSVVMSVNPQLQPSVLVSSLKCKLKFGEKEQKSPLIHQIIPDSKWQSLVNAGVNLNLGLDANLDIAVGIDAAELTKIVNLPDYDKLKASVRTKDKFKGFIKKIYSDNRIDVAAGKTGFKRVEDEGEKIIRLLKENDGYLPYYDKSEPDDIYSFFSMSKKTFKMTIGNLYKQKKLSLGKTGIRLID